MPIPLAREPGDGRYLYEVELVARGFTALGQGWLSEVLVGRITLSDACEQVRAKEQAASAKTTDAIG